MKFCFSVEILFTDEKPMEREKAYIQEINDAWEKALEDAGMRIIFWVSIIG